MCIKSQLEFLCNISNTYCHIYQWINELHTISSSTNQGYAFGLYVDGGRNSQPSTYALVEVYFQDNFSRKQMVYYWRNNVWNYNTQATPLWTTFIHNFESYASFDSPN